MTEKNKKIEWIIHTVGDKSAKIGLIESENPPKLVPLDKTKFIQSEKDKYFKARQLVVEKLEEANKLLPEGYQFKIYESYRSWEKQFYYWQKEVAKVTKEHPEWPQPQIIEKANEGIANPFNVGSGHQTGAAVDITLCYHGVEVDMGTFHLDTTNPQTPTFAEGLTQEQMKNRKLLYDVLESVGFANYPLEWWHYSIGDHEHAVIKNKPIAIFKAIKTPQKEKE